MIMIKITSLFTKSYLKKLKGNFELEISLNDLILEACTTIPKKKKQS